jgi:hypothetical protein
MRTNLIVVDDFYQNPDEVREFALKQVYTDEGFNYPGKRTIPCGISDECKDSIAALLLPHGGKIVNFGDYEGSPVHSGSFAMQHSRDRSSWIHADIYNNWAGMLYLHPDAPLNSGTDFYKHGASGDLRLEDREKYRTWSSSGLDASGSRGESHQVDAADFSKWEKVLSVGNVYNRLILFRADQFHTGGPYFGASMGVDARLTQIFFISTEY